VRSNAKDVRSNVSLHCLFEQGRTLACRGVSGERRYATMLKKAEVRSTARTAFDRTVRIAEIPGTRQIKKKKQ
jgi:hypothetical protein